MQSEGRHQKIPSTGCLPAIGINIPVVDFFWGGRPGRRKPSIPTVEF